MSHVLVLGAGPVGTTVATHLQTLGHHVTVVSRSGTAVAGARSLAADVRDPALGGPAHGCAAVVNALNPPYHRWQAEWPSLHEAATRLASEAGAPLVLIGNLYAYPVGSPMTAAAPLAAPTRKGAIRERMWRDLQAAHDAGRVRATEIRASDYVGGPSMHTDTAHAGRRLADPVLDGRTAWVLGRPDAPHTWTAVEDIARTVAAVIAADDAYGRPWVVPSAPACSIRDVARDLAAEAGAPEPTVRRIPRPALRAVGPFSRLLRETLEMTYQFDAPFVSDGTETTDRLGVRAQRWDRTIRAMTAARRPVSAL